MVLRWTKAATKDLREKISTDEINPNILTASYLGDVVSGEFYKQYKALPPNGRATAITRFFATVQAHSTRAGVGRSSIGKKRSRRRG